MPPEDTPPQRPRLFPGRRPGRFGRSARVGRLRLIMLVGVVAFFVGTVSLRGLASFYTDYLWFDSLGHRDVFTSVLGAQVVLVVLFTLLFFGNQIYNFAQKQPFFYGKRS